MVVIESPPRSRWRALATGATTRCPLHAAAFTRCTLLPHAPSTLHTPSMPRKDDIPDQLRFYSGHNTPLLPPTTHRTMYNSGSGINGSTMVMYYPQLRYCTAHGTLVQNYVAVVSYSLRSTPRYRLVCNRFPAPGGGMPRRTLPGALRLARCLGPGLCSYSHYAAVYLRFVCVTASYENNN